MNIEPYEPEYVRKKQLSEHVQLICLTILYKF